MQNRLCIVYQVDPRGLKVGGIETHVRMLIERAPADFEVMLIGVDARGDLEIGKPISVDFLGRRLAFLPVIHYPDDMAKEAASQLRNSLSLRFAAGLVRRLPAIRRFIGKAPVSFELERYEASWLPALLRVPFVTVVHNEYRRDNKTDSLIKTYWALHRANERFSLSQASRILCVNDTIRAMIARDYPAYVGKAEVMPVSIDTGRFQPGPFDTTDQVLRLAYAGRFEAQKDPGLMFRTIAAIRAKGVAVEFNYLGTSDPSRYEEFGAIRDCTVLHGFQRPEGVANILARCHAGILTSNFEGMPCFLLETLASGRPMGAIRLPQFDPLIVPGTSGFLVERHETPEASAEALADAFVELWADITSGSCDPKRIAEKAQPFSIDAQMPRLFAMHRALQAKDSTPPAVAQPISSAGPHRV